jgi:serine/threonine-protein kinase ULK4
VWLILEYCPGNRLSDLVQADLKLPESSVRMFGLNLLGALQFLHTNGIIYGNLKPSAVRALCLTTLRLRACVLRS